VVETTTIFETMLAPAPTRRAVRRKSRRGVSWLLTFAALGGLAYAGVTYGPELIEGVTDADESTGPDAALAYPVAVGAAVPVRTATFTVTEADAFGGIDEYEVTADFESGIARIVIPRAETPDLEILTLWDAAFVRSIDESTWYTLPRGDFPIDFSLGRSRWVRTIDELVPLATRQISIIDEATESSVGDEPTRRLVITTDANRLLEAQTASVTPTVDGSPAPAPPLPPGISVQPGGDPAGSVTMEIWVDDAGIVRRSEMPEELGGETVVVTSVSPDAWEPVFPTPDEVQPMTALVLFRLGL
jgi:hypothetical protein